MYDYKCDQCGHRFETRQSFSSEPVATCPECEGRASRQFVAVPIVFKGSGFYVNDYGKSSSGYTSKPTTSESTESESKSESKTETKAESTSTASSSTSTSSTKDD